MGNARVKDSLSQAYEQGRLPHAIMLHGGNVDALRAFAMDFTGKHLLEGEVQGHVDLFWIRPSNKMRQINVDSVKELLGNVYKSPKVGKHKVVLVEEVDRMNVAAANAFLKTLEEPPANTVIFLLTTKVLGILPTIRSRCLSYGLECKDTVLEHGDWKYWLSNYHKWLENGGGVVRAYALMAQFEGVLAQVLKDLLVDFEGDEAQEAGIKKGSVKTMLREIGEVTSDYLIIKRDPSEVGELFKHLERVAGLYEVNLNEMAVLESFLLKIA